MTEPTLVPCPTCGKSVEWSDASPYKPFCSRRCRLIDLGEWLDEGHRISGEEQDDNGSPWEDDHERH